MKNIINLSILAALSLFVSTSAIAAPPAAGAAVKGTGLTTEETIAVIQSMKTGTAQIAQYGTRGQLFMAGAGLRIQAAIQKGQSVDAYVAFVKQNQLTSNVLMDAVAEIGKNGEVSTEVLAKTSAISNYTASLVALQARTSVATQAKAGNFQISDAEALAAYRNADFSASERAARRQSQLVNLEMQGNEGARAEMKLVGRVAFAGDKGACSGVTVSDCQSVVRSMIAQWYETAYLDAVSKAQGEAQNIAAFMLEALYEHLGHPNHDAIVLGLQSIMKSALAAGGIVKYAAVSPQTAGCVLGKKGLTNGKTYTLAP